MTREENLEVLSRLQPLHLTDCRKISVITLLQDLGPKSKGNHPFYEIQNKSFRHPKLWFWFISLWLLVYITYTFHCIENGSSFVFPTIFIPGLWLSPDDAPCWEGIFCLSYHLLDHLVEIWNIRKYFGYSPSPISFATNCIENVTPWGLSHNIKRARKTLPDICYNHQFM